MRLTPGAPAPLFTVAATDGRPVTLEAWRGAPILLSFYRSASCPLCSLRLWYMAQQAPKLQARGLRLIAIFESDQAETLHYCLPARAPFPLIADPGKKIFARYGVGASWMGVALGFIRRLGGYAEAYRRRVGGIVSTGDMALMPADFLITPDLTIAVAHYGRDTGDHVRPETIERFLRRYAPVRA